MSIATINMADLDRLMPMHVVINASGHVTHAGTTLNRLTGGRVLLGSRFLEIFEVRRPATLTSVEKLREFAGQKLYLRLRSDPGVQFKGIAAPDSEGGGVLLNLSFGISVVEAVRRYDLTSADFAPTDLTVEMLYLVEAKSAVMDELKHLNSRLHHGKIAAEEQALTDTLTGLANRRAMDQVLTTYINRDERFGLMHLDLDFFKDVNDTLGHAAGDHVLQHVSQVLVAETRSDDTVVRAGGDEFVIVFPQITDAETLNDIAMRIISKLEVPILFQNQPCRISASVGTTVSDYYDTADADKMLADADVALYESKNQGRARATLYSGALLADAKQTPEAKKPLSPGHH